MNSSQLRNRVRIERPATGQDSIGQPVAGWDLVATVWADIRFQTGMQVIKDSDAKTDASIVRASIRIRYRTGLDSSMRAVWGATVFEINSVLPDPGREYVDLVCQVVQ